LYPQPEQSFCLGSLMPIKNLDKKRPCEGAFFVAIEKIYRIFVE
jgi:hypothetical protein